LFFDIRKAEKTIPGPAVSPYREFLMQESGQSSLVKVAKGSGFRKLGLPPRFRFDFKTFARFVVKLLWFRLLSGFPSGESNRQSKQSNRIKPISQWQPANRHCQTGRIHPVITRE
jgi:hypothetical protein